ncbi:MAG: rod shape-determining protein MreC [Candidatus Zixiibacteriota bacterium]|nr:MAG: rod shape-determining protein MreC [candidate division Zixibacteria bacterium]
MNWITNLFARHWRNIHLLAIALLSVILIVAPSVVMPTVNQAILSVFYWPFAEIKTGLGDLHAVGEENHRLRQMLTQANVNLSMYQEAVRENARLRSVLGFEQQSGYILLPVEVMSISGDYFPVSAVINGGSNDSIFVDQPVINQNGLIGRIVSVASDYATVQLLTDPSNRVAARIAQSREMGIIRFTVSEGMILDNLPVQGAVNVNDTVLSSGLGGVYPPGLRVGVVSSVERPELEPFCRITVTPFVDFHSLDELFVLNMEGR